MEHYEIASYGSARTLAEYLGHEEVVKLLQETLDEEGEADKKLTDVSISDVLPSVAAEEEEEDEDEDEEVEEEEEVEA